MTYSARLVICAVASVASHLLLARGTASLQGPVKARPPVVLRVEVHQPAAPEPEPEPEENQQPKKQPVHETPNRRARTVADSTRPTPTKNVTPTERPDTSDNASDTPVFGISMESTSAAGSGPSMRVGNTLQTKPRDHADEAEPGGARPLAAPVPAYQVTKMPLPRGDCSGHYTDEAREAGLEGTVILTFVVDEQGHVRDIKVLQGLGSGLTEAAKRAVQTCSFSPGERDGKPVPTRISSFKIRFSLRENE